MSATAVTEDILLDRIKSGRLIEHSSQATERYIEGLKRTLIVSADTELISAPAYMNATKDFSTLPSINNYITVMGIVQDELGHAHIAYRMLRDLGVDTEELVYERKPRQFKYPYAFDVPLESFTELIVANGFYDRAGFVLLSDIHRNCSYGPWKRALVKVDREENFHLRHGEKWMKAFSKDPEKKEELQRAVDWMFVLTLEWFGLPDGRKRHNEQIEYGYKGSTNDQLRQTWMSHTVPLCESLGLEVPAHYDEQEERFVIDCPFPAQFDAEEKRWLFEEGEISWDDVLKRWKDRGPKNEEYVEHLAAELVPGEGRLAGDRPFPPGEKLGKEEMEGTRTRTKEEVRDALREVLDPEYPISLVDLGLIRGIEVKGSGAEIELTYTCMGCPAMDMIQDDIRDRILEMDGIDEVGIEVVWETWSRKDITPLGKKQLKRVGVV
jgi:ring-1,2-phenylacetyl-CoA epoxidase subunit PaaA